MRLTENTKVVMRDAIVGASTDFNTATKSVNMAKYAKCRIMLFITTAGTVGDCTVTLKQGSTTTCSTALGFTEYWKCETITSDTAAADALTRVSATTLTTAGPATATGLYIFEVRADMLDTDTFKSENQYIRCDVATGSNKANISHAALIYELYEPRYARGAENMPSVNS